MAAEPDSAPWIVRFIAGQGGKTKHAIENATRVRIVVADARVHILGAFANIAVARDAVCSLILGSEGSPVQSYSCRAATLR